MVCARFLDDAKAAYLTIREAFKVVETTESGVTMYPKKGKL
jgi:hypothetical protein